MVERKLFFNFFLTILIPVLRWEEEVGVSSSKGKSPFIISVSATEQIYTETDALTNSRLRIVIKPTDTLVSVTNFYSSKAFADITVIAAFSGVYDLHEDLVINIENCTVGHLYFGNADLADQEGVLPFGARTRISIKNNTFNFLRVGRILRGGKHSISLKENSTMTIQKNIVTGLFHFGYADGSSNDGGSTSILCVNNCTMIIEENDVTGLMSIGGSVGAGLDGTLSNITIMNHSSLVVINNVFTSATGGVTIAGPARDLGAESLVEVRRFSKIHIINNQIPNSLWISTSDTSGITRLRVLDYSSILVERNAISRDLIVGATSGNGYAQTFTTFDRHSTLTVLTNQVENSLLISAGRGGFGSLNEFNITGGGSRILVEDNKVGLMNLYFGTTQGSKHSKNIMWIGDYNNDVEDDDHDADDDGVSSGETQGKGGSVIFKENWGSPTQLYFVHSAVNGTNNFTLSNAYIGFIQNRMDEYHFWDDLPNAAPSQIHFLGRNDSSETSQGASGGCNVFRETSGREVFISLRHPSFRTYFCQLYEGTTTAAPPTPFPPTPLPPSTTTTELMSTTTTPPLPTNPPLTEPLQVSSDDVSQSDSSEEIMTTTTISLTTAASVLPSTTLDFAKENQAPSEAPAVDGEGSGLSSGVVLGIVGILLFVGLVAGFAVWKHQQRKKGLEADRKAKAEEEQRRRREGSSSPGAGSGNEPSSTGGHTLPPKPGTAVGSPRSEFSSLDAPTTTTVHHDYSPSSKYEQQQQQQSTFAAPQPQDNQKNYLVASPQPHQHQQQQQYYYPPPAPTAAYHLNHQPPLPSTNTAAVQPAEVEMETTSYPAPREGGAVGLGIGHHRQQPQMVTPDVAGPAIPQAIPVSSGHGNNGLEGIQQGQIVNSTVNSSAVASSSPSTTKQNPPLIVDPPPPHEFTDAAPSIDEVLLDVGASEVSPNNGGSIHSATAAAALVNKEDSISSNPSAGVGVGAASEEPLRVPAQTTAHQTEEQQPASTTALVVVDQQPPEPDLLVVPSDVAPSIDDVLGM